MPAPFHGPRAGVESVSITADHTLNGNDKVCQVITPDAAWTVNITTVARAGFGFRIKNAATVAGRTLAITDIADAAVVTIDAGEVYDVIGNGTAFIPFALNENTIPSLTTSTTATWGLSGSSGSTLTLTLDAINAGAGEGRLILAADDQININDGTADIQMDAGVITETGMVSLDFTPSGTMVLRGGGVSTFGDDTGYFSFDGAGTLTTSGLVASTVTTSGAQAFSAATGFTFDATGASAPILFRMGDDAAGSVFTLENNSLQDLITVTADAQHAYYIKDDSTTAYLIAQAGNTYLGIDTSNAGALMYYGNTSTFPTHTFRGFMTTDDAVASGTARRVGGYLSRLSAPGADHTNSTDETALANVTIPANTLKAGTVLVVRFKAVVTANNGATTCTNYLRLTSTSTGLGGTALITGGAVDTDAGFVWVGEYRLNCHAAPGAAASIVGYGSYRVIAASPGGTLTAVEMATGTTFATNAALYISMTADWSAADANSIRAEIFDVEIIG